MLSKETQTRKEALPQGLANPFTRLHPNRELQTMAVIKSAKTIAWDVSLMKPWSDEGGTPSGKGRGDGTENLERGPKKRRKILKSQKGRPKWKSKRNKITGSRR